MSTITPPAIINTLKDALDIEQNALVTKENSALIIVDIQHDFLPGGSLAVKGGNEIIPLINSLQIHFPLIVATQDWHPTQHKSFASNHPNKNVFDTIQWQGMDQVLWPDHCVQGTEGADFPVQLYTKRIEAIIRKGMDKEIDSYSGFYDNGRRKSTGLAGYLKERGITSIYVCGLAADFCVYYTALDGLSLGFDSFIIEDASRAINEEGYALAKKDFLSKKGKVIVSSDLTSE